MLIILGIFLILAGVLMLFSPDTWFEFTEWWKSYSAEPSDTYILFTRIGGAVVIAVGILSVVYSFF